MTDLHPLPVSAAAIAAARQRLAGQAVVTPLVESAALNRAVGGRVLVKAEVLQITGSFKFRGAWNRMSQLSPAELRAGVVACSSGNHAQAVAAVAQRLGCAATIVMPADAPATKIARTRGYGAEIVTYDRAGEDRDAIAARLAAARGAPIVWPFDDPHIIAGQGTMAAEALEQARAHGVAGFDRFLVCCSGGGLTSGTAVALKAANPATRIVAVEPAGFDDIGRSLAAGRRVANRPGARSICDALLIGEPGRIPFQIMQALDVATVTVTDDEVLAAIRFAFDHLRLVVEPGGAAALAALLHGRVPTDGVTGLVLSGGNVDAPLFTRALAPS